RNAFALSVLDLPVRRLHVLAGRADRHLDVLAAEPEGRTAAVHGRVAAANDHDPPADAVDVLEGDRGQEVDADVDIGGAFLTAGDVEIFPLRGSGADEYGVEALVENGLEA